MGFVTGSVVRKKSNKPFQNGLKVAEIESFSTMTHPCQDKLNNKTVDAVALVGCKGLVATSILREEV